jgi:hypothetical protein
MKYHILLVLGLAVPALFFLLARLTMDQPWNGDLLYWGSMSARVIALIGSLIGMFCFKPGEYLRKAWAFLAFSYILFIASSVLFGAHGSLPSTSVIRLLLVGAGNVSAVIGIWLLARTWHSAGLEYSGSLAFSLSVTISGIALAILMAGPSVVGGLEAIVVGMETDMALTNMISCFADLISLAMVAPMLLTALALRGGPLFWTWFFLFSNLFGWLLFDAVFAWGPDLGMSEATVSSASHTFRILACLLLLLAGLSQRFVIQGVKK